MELLNDNDNIVRLKALSTYGKLVSAKYIDLDMIQSDIWPCFLHFVQTTFDED